MLSRRDEFAKAAMQGILSVACNNPGIVVRDAIECADALIAKLDEGQEPGDCCKVAIADIEARANNVEAEMREMLRDNDAEIARLRAELVRINGRFNTAHEVIAHRENELTMLRAELARYTSDLTDDEYAALSCSKGLDQYPSDLPRIFDAALRLVRGGE